MIQKFLANRRGPWSVTAALLVSFMVFAPAESRAEAYIGGSIGQSYIELNAGTPAVPAPFDEADFGWKAMIGYEFDFVLITLGVEADYVDFGAPSGNVLGTQIEVDANGFAGFGTAGFDLGPDGFDSGSEDGTDPAYGVGVKFGLASVEVRGEYEIYDIEDSEDIAMLSVGFVWRF
jgi:hypothetical protein